MTRSATRTALAVVFLVFAGLRSPAESAAAGDPQALLARFKEAAGGAAWDSVATLSSRGTLSVGGLDGTFEGIEELRTGRSRVRYDLKVAKGEQGFDGERPWELTPSGEVVVKSSENDLEGARTDAYRTARAFWFPERFSAEVAYDRAAELGGRACHVLRLHPTGGREFELWLDAVTFLMVQTVEVGATQTTTVTYSDWKAVGALKLPFTSFSTTGHPG